MWVDDYVNIAVVEAMALSELMDEEWDQEFMDEAEEIDALADFLGI